MPARCSVNARVSPPIPAPTMMTSAGRSVMGGRPLGRLAAHYEGGCRSAQGRQRADRKERYRLPLQRQDDTADDGTDDRTDAADPEGPADASRADRRRVERSGQRIGADLRADDAEAGAENSGDEQGERGAGHADRYDEQAGN